MSNTSGRTNAAKPLRIHFTISKLQSIIVNSFINTTITHFSRKCKDMLTIAVGTHIHVFPVKIRAVFNIFSRSPPVLWDKYIDRCISHGQNFSGWSKTERHCALFPIGSVFEYTLFKTEKSGNKYSKAKRAPGPLATDTFHCRNIQYTYRIRYLWRLCPSFRDTRACCDWLACRIPFIFITNGRYHPALSVL